MLIYLAGQCDKPIDVRGGTIAVAYSTTADVLTDLMSTLRMVSCVNMSKKAC